MNRYLVTLDIELRHCVEVSASDEEDALEKALEAYDAGNTSEHDSEQIIPTIEELTE